MGGGLVGKHQADAMTIVSAQVRLHGNRGQQPGLLRRNTLSNENLGTKLLQIGDGNTAGVVHRSVPGFFSR